MHISVEITVDNRVFSVRLVRNWLIQSLVLYVNDEKIVLQNYFQRYLEAFFQDFHSTNGRVTNWYERGIEGETLRIIYTRSTYLPWIFPQTYKLYLTDNLIVERTGY